MMSGSLIGALGVAALFLLLALRMPVGIAMLLVGFCGTWALNGLQSAYATMANEAYVMASYYELIVIPLFVLLGNVASVSGMSRDLYAAAYAWIGPVRGGLATATILGCSGFAALSGSSVASAATMGGVALPEMKRYGYDPRLATGAVAAGGTLGILIPPSTGFVIYAILTEESIGRLFMAGVLPGILLTLLFVATVIWLTQRNPKLGPPGPPADAGARRRSLLQAAPMLGIILGTIGGIYLGIFTPVEASGIGAFLACLIAMARRSLDRRRIEEVLLATVRTSAMCFLILIGAHVFSPFLALTHIPDILGDALLGLELNRYVILGAILIVYILLGTFLEGFAMLVLTLPIVFPIITALGFDPIWFGVLVVITLEMGLISPPVGVNVFVVKALAEDVPMRKVFEGILPFWIAMVLCLILLILFPDIALMLPRSMLG